MIEAVSITWPSGYRSKSRSKHTIACHCYPLSVRSNLVNGKCKSTLFHKVDVLSQSFRSFTFCLSLTTTCCPKVTYSGKADIDNIPAEKNG